MKYVKTEADRFRIVSFVYRFLIIILILLSLLIISGTIYGMFFYIIPADDKSDSVSHNVGEQGKGQTFTAIGKIRVSTANPQPGMVVLFVSFIYYPDDKAFSEELVLRINDFRDVIRAYIGSFSITELQKMDEEMIKTELLRRFNVILRLGQIETLYFNDFMIVG